MNNAYAVLLFILGILLLCMYVAFNVYQFVF